jgi:peptidoglycan/xylan/chitin deacetylase (PgdA/CDA1 family)
MYHDVTPAAARDSSGFTGPGPDRYKLTPELFAEHLDAIAASGLRPSLVTEPAGNPIFHLTFDDGGSSAAAIAAALAEHDFVAHFFVTTSRLGSPGFLGPDELRALRAAGHSVGSHSHTHPALSRLTDAEIAGELETSRRVLEGLLSEEIATVSVPGGFYSLRVAEIGAACGFTHLFTSEPWLEPRRIESACVLGRFAVVADTSAEDVAALCRLSRPAVLRAAISWRVRRSVRAALGPVYSGLRTRLLSRR